MSTIKRAISLLLVLGVFLSVLAPATQASPLKETAVLDTNVVAAEGNSGIGNLLTQEIIQSQTEAEESATEYAFDYTVTDLVIENGVATVTYESMEEATLVVALYTEDGMQLLTSATATVAPDETEVSVTFEEKLPEYFLASAYLVNSYDLTPLCAAYDTPMYTREMQALMAATIHDFDSDRVVNLDDSETTNFAVYDDSTILIEPVEGKNIVAFIDETTYTYVIENADEQVISLTEGSVFVYPYAEDETLIAKVAQISVDGTTVTIGVTETSASEVFKVVKIDTTEITEPSTSYENTSNHAIGSECNEEEKDTPDEWESNEIRYNSEIIPIEGDIISGEVQFSIVIEYMNYQYEGREWDRFCTEGNVHATITASGAWSGEFPLGKVVIDPFAGIDFVFEPVITIDINCQVDAAFSLSVFGGFERNDGEGEKYKSIYKKPKLEFEGLDANCEITCVFDPAPQLEFLSSEFAELKLSLPIGLKAQIKENVSGVISDEKAYHECEDCYHLVLTPSFNVVLKIESFLIPDVFNDQEIEILDVSDDIEVAYYSVDFNEFGIGQCKHIYSGLTVMVLDAAYQQISNASVTVSRLLSDESVTQETNRNGIAVFTLNSGHYKISATYDGMNKTKTVKFDKAGTHTITLGVDDNTLWEKIGMKCPWWLRDKLKYDGREYTLFEDKADSWEEAKEYCEKKGGHLATLTSEAENKAVYDYIKRYGFKNAYFGLTDSEREDQWKWVTGEPYDYENWAEGEPNDAGNGEDYAMFYFKYASGDLEGQWNDGNYGNGTDRDEPVFICEWDNPIIDDLEATDSVTRSHGGSETAPNAFYPGDHEIKVTDSYILETATFKDLVPNEQYILWVLADDNPENPLAVDNLLFIDQAIAREDGTLDFEFVQKNPENLFYVFVSGASNRDLNDAEITLPEMIADGELQTVSPVVVYDGEVLAEGVDYVVTGDATFTEPGAYVCYIHGINDYTGVVECAYRVKSAQQENPFTDVPEASFYYKPVLWAVENKITAGMTDTTFAPMAECTRAQVVTFLWRAAGCPEPVSTEHPFTDVEEGRFYYKAMLWAVENGIAYGLTETTFAPDAKCTRAQVVTFLWRSVDCPGFTSAEHPFTDVKEGTFYYKAMLWAVENEITAGMTKTTFAPDATCTRGQVVTFLYRVYN